MESKTERKHQNSEAKKDIGARLRYYRELKGKSLKDFAAEIGVDKGNLSKTENGIRGIDQDFLLAIKANNNKFNIAWLIDGTGTPEYSKKDAEQFAIPLLLESLMEHYCNRLSPNNPNEIMSELMEIFERKIQ